MVPAIRGGREGARRAAVKPVVAALAAVALLSAAGCRSSEPAGRPPVVVILADTLRADYMGAYGFQGDVSPNLDAIAARGVVFENCVAQSPWTKPSIATLFTGLYPEVHKVLTENGQYRERATRKPETDIVSDDAATLAEQLRARGYATAGFVANPWIRAAHGYGQGFDVFNTDGAANEMPGSEIVARALRWLGERKQGEPYFLYLHLMDTHGPYRAADEHFHALAGSSAAAGDPIVLNDALFERIPPYLRVPEWTKAEDSRDVRVWRQRYAAGLRSLDAALAPLFAELQQRGEFDDALIVFTADHGEELFDHGRWDHGYTLYEHQTHVPLIVRYPGAAHAGKRVEPVVGLLDVMPTVLDVAGATIPPATQGKALTALIEGGAKVREAIFSEAVKWRPEMRSVRTTRHKLIVDEGDDTRMLFDLEADPGEKRNLATAERETTDRLLALLRLHQDANAAHSGLAGGTAEVPEDVAERLRALGYLE
jgi:arylsulfatase A-like enzyme